jgi:hypothetical protein
MSGFRFTPSAPDVFAPRKAERVDLVTVRVPEVNEPPVEAAKAWRTLPGSTQGHGLEGEHLGPRVARGNKHRSIVKSRLSANEGAGNGEVPDAAVTANPTAGRGLE